MVDPSDVTNFKRTQSELEEFLLFCIVVAGKTAIIQAKKLNEFLTNDISLTPFQLIKQQIKRKILLDKIKEVKLGQYSRLERAFTQVINLDVFTCTVAELEGIIGIGPKTARFFILHSRANQKLAVLDTHILKWLRDELKLDTPKSTPNSKQYLILEQEFLNHCKKHKISPATLDLEIWNKYSTKKTLTT